MTGPSAPQGHLPPRATRWHLRTRSLEFQRLPVLMGIVNVTPDSFSDGGQFLAARAAREHALRLVEAGAAILDVGGESTRPYSQAVALAEELDRVLPVIESLVNTTDVPISIDTSKAEVARRALDLGAEIVNDVTAGDGDPAMLGVWAESLPGVCLMHMQGTPATMQDDPRYDDVVGDVKQYLERRVAVCVSAGIPPERLCLDPGVGFGKTRQHNLQLLANAWRFFELGYPVLIGHSRKGFLGKAVGDDRRLFGTVGCAAALASQGVQVLRVHDVAEVAAGLRAFAAAGGLDGEPYLPESEA